MATYELILLTLKGDQNAARALVKILVPIFHNEAQYAIWRERGTIEDVKELVNDIFADLFSDRASRLRQFDREKGASPEGYFRRFARLRCMGFARDERDRLLAQLTEPGDLDEWSANPHLLRLQQVLTATDFEVFNRRYLQGQETAAIGAAMNFSREVYFQHIHQLSERLRQHGLLEKEYRDRRAGTTGPRLFPSKAGGPGNPDPDRQP